VLTDPNFWALLTSQVFCLIWGFYLGYGYGKRHHTTQQQQEKS